MTALIISVLLFVIMVWIELIELNATISKKPMPPRVWNKAVRYSDFDCAVRGMRDEAPMGWEVVSHSVSPDGGWYVVYKRYKS